MPWLILYVLRILEVYDDKEKLDGFLVTRQKELTEEAKEMEYKLMLLDTARKRLRKEQKMSLDVTIKTIPERYAATVHMVVPHYEVLWSSILVTSVTKMLDHNNPTYRGRAGEISTQYSNLHPNPDEKFYIPDNVYIIGTMFDGAWLWEEYVNSLIEDIFYHPMNKGGKGAQRLFDGNIGMIYPDFISRDNEKRIIADAKYKPTDNIGGKDYLQLLAYMLRFDAKTGYYLYPDSQSTGDVRLMLNEGVKYENNVKAREDICVIKHGLQIPDNTNSYQEFSAFMKSSEDAFKNIFAFA